MDNRIVVITEHRDGRIHPITYELAAFAADLADRQPAQVELVIIGRRLENAARELARRTGYDVTALQVPHLADYNAEVYRSVLQHHLFRDGSWTVCLPHTSLGMDLAPALAVLLDGACITAVEAIEWDPRGPKFSRGLFGGKFQATVRPSTASMVLSIQPGMFHPREIKNRPAGRVRLKTIDCEPQWCRSLGVRQSEGEDRSLAQADVVVAAGRGIGIPENLSLIEDLAGLFAKSAVAGSRPLCDLGWLEYRRQVGVTGMTVAPRLYMACGISGALQHVSGMRASGFIVAINSAADAPIFGLADIAVVEDLTTFIPALLETAEEDRAGPGTSPDGGAF